MKKLFSIFLVTMMLLSSVTALAEEWTCASCGNIASGNFCSNCGAAKPSEDWICPNCNSNVKGNFCSNCGTARPSHAAAPTVTTAPTQVKKDPDAFKQIINYLLNPFSNGNVTALIPIDEETFTFTMSSGESYMGLMSSSDGVYGIEIMNASSSDYKSIDNPYDVKSDEFTNVLNYLLENDERSVKAIIPLLGGIYTVQDTAGDTYMLTILCSPAMIAVALTGD